MVERRGWFGSSDPVVLGGARQAIAHGIVTGFHPIYDARGVMAAARRLLPGAPAR